MPTPAGFADCAVSINLTGFPRTAYVTFGVDPTSTNPDTVASQVASCLIATGSLFSLLSPQARFSGVRVALGTDGGEDLVGFSPMSTTGTNAVTVVSANCAALIHKRTARGGRRGKGRMYLPWCLAENLVDEAGVLGSTPITNINTACGVFLAALEASPGPMVLLHEPSAPGTEHPTTPGAPNVVTSMTTDSIVGTQRRRLGR